MTSVLYDVPGPAARRRVLIGSLIFAVLAVALAAWVFLRLYDRGIFEYRRWDIFVEDPRVWPSLARAWWNTVRAAAVASVLALILGTLFAVWRMSQPAWLRWPANVVVEFFRGMPLLLLILFALLGFGLNAFQSLVIGLTLYNGAVIGEILRAGILSLPTGQREAGMAIGLTRGQVLRLVLLPQAVRRMAPSLVSQLVVLLKDTSLGFIVAYVELLRIVRLNSDFFGNRYLFSFFFVATAMYILTNYVVSRFAVWLERRGTPKAAGGAAPATAPDAGDPNVPAAGPVARGG
jgi:glutamate transport system permease protein